MHHLLHVPAALNPFHYVIAFWAYLPMLTLRQLSQTLQTFLVARSEVPRFFAFAAGDGFALLAECLCIVDTVRRDEDTTADSMAVRLVLSRALELFVGEGSHQRRRKVASDEHERDETTAAARRVPFFVAHCDGEHLLEACIAVVAFA